MRCCFFVLVEQSGSRRSWNPIVSPASGSPEPSASPAELPVDREAAGAAVGVESIEHLKEDFSINEIIPPNDSQDHASDKRNQMNAAEGGREADDVREADDSRDADDGRDAGDYGDFQESWGQNAVETNHDRTEDIAKPDGSAHLDQSPANSESAEVRNVISHVLCSRKLALWLVENSTLKKRFCILVPILPDRFRESLGGFLSGNEFI